MLATRPAGADWTNDPTVNGPVCTATRDQINPQIMSDGSGGAIITWQDRQNGVDYDIYAQRVLSSGTLSGPPPPPTVTSITPNTDGVNTGTVSITNLAGTRFNTGGATAALKKAGQADTPGTAVVVVTSARITCTFNLTGVATGAWDVVVTTNGGTGALATGFTVTNPAALPPTVTSITPSSGANRRTIDITNLTGTGFDGGGATVTLMKTGQPDITGTAVAVVSATQITCTFDLTGVALGALDVVVTTNAGTATLTGGFTALDPPLAALLSGNVASYGQSAEAVSSARRPAGDSAG